MKRRQSNKFGSAGQPQTALVRAPGQSFRLAVSSHPERDLIDPDRARLQHAVYRAALKDAGLEVIALPPLEAHPDACFTQDPALVIDGHLLMLRAGIPSRRGEGDSLAAALEPRVESISWMEEPATLEGGDVLRLGARLVVGLSQRTNREGVEALRRFAEPLGYTVAAVPVPEEVLHLSTAATILNEELVIGLDPVIFDPAFEGLERLPMGDAPLAACNLLVVGKHAIASGDYPVHDQLEERGYEVTRLDLDEFERADAGPTCLSLVVDWPGSPTA